MSHKPGLDHRTSRYSLSIGLPTLVALLLLSPPNAGAQTVPSPSPAVDSRVQSLINEGVEFRNKGDDQAALASFLEAYEISKEARVLAQIALAEQALGRWVDAEAHLAKALQSTEDPFMTRNRTPLEGALTEIQRHVGSLELSGGIPGAEVRLNGTPAGVFPFKDPIRTLAGSVALEVRADGYLPVIRTVIVPVGGLARETVTLVSVGPVVSTVPNLQPISQPDRASKPNAWSTGKKVALGLGIGAMAAAASGAVFYILYRGKSDDFQKSIDHEGARCTTADLVDNCKPLYDDIHRAQILSAVGFAGAAVLVGAATYLVMTDQAPDHAGVAAGDRTLSLRCLPTVGVGLTCAGAF